MGQEVQEVLDDALLLDELDLDLAEVDDEDLVDVLGQSCEVELLELGLLLVVLEGLGQEALGRYFGLDGVGVLHGFEEVVVLHLYLKAFVWFG